MDKQQLIQLIEKQLTVQKIADELKCSFTNVRYWLRKYKLNTKTYENKNMKCKQCGGSLKGRQTDFCSKQCNTKFYPNNGGNAFAARARQRGVQRKIAFVNQLGGKCSECGYSKNLSVLTFHHINPENKSFNLDVRKMTNTNLTSLEVEVKKCKLLCMNCHAETHYPKYNGW